MTTTPTPPTTQVTYGMEYHIVPEGSSEESPEFGSPIPYNWQSKTFNDLPDYIELNGFRIKSRFYKQTKTITKPDNPTDPDEEDYTREYPGWQLISQQLRITNYNNPVFSTDNGDELFGGTPKNYGVDEFSEAGIKDGTEYSYTATFDKAQISYLPRCSPYSQGYTDNPATMPSTPSEYPIDALSSFLPDDRESVDVKYELTTTYRGSTGGNQTDTIDITHTLLQDQGDITGKLKSYLHKTYFYNGYRHIQLYELDQEPVYDDNGNLIKPDDFKEPIYDDNKNLLNSVTGTNPTSTIEYDERTPDD